MTTDKHSGHDEHGAHNDARSAHNVNHNQYIPPMTMTTSVQDDHGAQNDNEEPLAHDAQNGHDDYRAHNDHDVNNTVPAMSADPWCPR